jgi:hypothetical protein
MIAHLLNDVIFFVLQFLLGREGERDTIRVFDGSTSLEKYERDLDTSVRGDLTDRENFNFVPI